LAASLNGTQDLNESPTKNVDREASHGQTEKMRLG
jgi:hypothetical protein